MTGAEVPWQPLLEWDSLQVGEALYGGIPDHSVHLAAGIVSAAS